LRSKEASDREGLVCYDLSNRKFLWMRGQWGHPAWHPDSSSLINCDGKGLYEIDARTGTTRRREGLPAFPGSHPSLSPDGALFATDFIVTEGKSGLWGVAVGTLGPTESQVLHRFDNSRGSTSWRRSHPHPIFSHDGKRVYFNFSADRWTRLYVAEREGKE
jgi:Tol biopolymer transport system component